MSAHLLVANGQDRVPSPNTATQSPRNQLLLDAPRPLTGKEMSAPHGAIGNEPQSLDKLNWLLHLQYVRGETQICKELISREIKNSGGRNDFAYFKQGEILRDDGKIQEALDSFQICIKLNPTNSEYIKEAAKCLYEMNRFKLALEAYLEAERVSKSADWQIYYNLGNCLLRLGQIDKAKDYAQRAVQLGKHESAYLLLSQILISQNELKSAITTCNSAILACPDSVDMLTKGGILHLKCGETQQAFERLSSALALEPTCVKALLGIGSITQSHEDHDVALTKYKMAVTHESNSVAIWNNIGMCFYARHKYVAAISCLKRALWISPIKWQVLYNLGLAHLATRQPASAFNFLCATVNLMPKIPQTFMLMGRILLELDDVPNASRAFKQALVLAPGDPLTLINCTVCHIMNGSWDEAEDVFKKFREFQQTQKDKIQLPVEVLSLAENIQTILTTNNKSVNTGEASENNFNDPKPPENDKYDYEDELV